MDDEDIDFGYKLHCVDELAKRWWYALPAWPPANHCYTDALAQLGLRRVEQAKWRSEKDVETV